VTTPETGTALARYQLVIDGRRVEAASGQRYDSVDPYLGAPWASAADGGAADVDLAVAAARWPPNRSTARCCRSWRAR